MILTGLRVKSSSGSSQEILTEYVRNWIRHILWMDNIDIRYCKVLESSRHKKVPAILIYLMNPEDGNVLRKRCREVKPKGVYLSHYILCPKERWRMKRKIFYLRRARQQGLRAFIRDEDSLLLIHKTLYDITNEGKLKRIVTPVGDLSEQFVSALNII